MNSGLHRARWLFLATLLVCVFPGAFIVPYLSTRNSPRDSDSQTSALPLTISKEVPVQKVASTGEVVHLSKDPIDVHTATEPPASATGISGRVLDTQGNPITGCEVIFLTHASDALKLFKDRGRYRIGELFAITDATGEYSQSELPAGEYTVVFRAPGYVYAEHAATIQLKPGEITRATDQIMEKASVIFGQVVENVSGDPVPGAKITAEAVPSDQASGDRPPDSGALTVMANQEGRFRFDMLLPSRKYNLSAKHDAYITEQSLDIAVDLDVPVRIVLSRGGTIEGIVIDRDTQRPVADVEISISPDRGPFRRIRSATDGTFLVQGLAAGETYVFAEKDGFFAERLPEHKLDVRLGSRHFLKMILLPGARIEITVIDKETGGPIAGAEVRIDRSKETLVTDQEGKALFAGLNPCCMCEVSMIRAKGFASIGLPGGGGFLSRSTDKIWNLRFDPKIDHTIQRTFELEREHVFFGTVVEADEHPVPGAEIQVQVRGYAPPAAPVLTDASGAFRVRGLEAREYRYTARKNGYAPTEGSVNTEEQKEVRIVLLRGATLEGTVKDGEGRPMEGFHVEFRSLDQGPWPPAAESNAHGEWKIEHVPPGSYAVTAEKDPMRTQRVDLELAEGDRKHIDLLASKCITVAGRVVGGKDRVGVEGVELALERVETYGPSIQHNEIRRTNTKTDSEGRFVLRDVPPGEYRMKIKDVPKSHLRPPHPRPDTEKRYRFGEENVTDLVIELKKAATVSGVVLFHSGEPAPGAKVSIEREGTLFGFSIPGAKSNEEGLFEIIGLYPGTGYRIRADMKGYGAAFSDSFNVRQGDVRDGVVLRLQEPGSVSGTIRDDDGNPVTKGYRVACVSSEVVGSGVGSHPLGQARPDESGNYTVTDLPPGEVMVALWGPVPCIGRTSFGPGSSIETCSAVKQSQPAAVASGKDTGGIDFIVSDIGEPTGRIEGRVVSSDGRGVSGATIHAFTRDYWTDRREGGEGKATTDENGSFRIEGIIEGTFTLSVYHSDYVNGRFEDIASPSDDVRIVLKSPARLEGRVVRGDTGESVPEFTVACAQKEEWLRDQTVRNPEGRFHFEKMAPATYLLRARAAGIGQAQTSVTLEAGAVSEVVIRLRPEIRLLGRVVHGRDLSPATGAVIEPGTERETTAGLDGRFALVGLFPGERTITIRHPDYGTQTFPGVTIPEAGATREILFKLLEAGKIEGHVFDRFGNPVEGALIFLDEYQGEKRFTDYDGFYEFVGVQPGPHLVGWHMDAVGTGGGHKRNVEVGPGLPTVVDFRETGAVVSGIVTDNGKPRHLDSVSFTKPGFERSVQTDRTGRFEISGLEAGTYRARVEANMNRDKVIERTVQVPASGEIHLEFRYP